MARKNLSSDAASSLSLSRRQKRSEHVPRRERNVKVKVHSPADDHRERRRDATRCGGPASEEDERRQWTPFPVPRGIARTREESLARQKRRTSRVRDVFSTKSI